MGIPVSGRQEPDPWHNIPGDLELVSVVINKFEDNEFFASLRFKRGNKTKEFRIQLTEAIIASIIKEVPIFVEESVLVKAGVTV
jgi:bifunctional DNase/RNase